MANRLYCRFSVYKGWGEAPVLIALHEAGPGTAGNGDNGTDLCSLRSRHRLLTASFIAPHPPPGEEVPHRGHLLPFPDETGKSM